MGEADNSRFVSAQELVLVHDWPRKHCNTWFKLMHVPLLFKVQNKSSLKC